MDAIRNNNTGVVHLAMSGTDYTLCGVTELNKRIRETGTVIGGKRYFSPEGDWLGWDELLIGANTSYAKQKATCKICLRILK